MIFIPTYLRPLSQVRTGNQSAVDVKADEVEAIHCPTVPTVAFEQHEAVNVWVHEQAYYGKEIVTSDRKISPEMDVDHPERHWWIISNGLLEDIDPPLREHADIFDLLITLNLCTDDPVFFSQDPGQVVSGVYLYERGTLEYRDDFSLGSFATALRGLNEIPTEIELTGDIASVYEQVRNYRSKRLETDAGVDLRIALHMYDDALSANFWTAGANFYYVCENVLASGYSNTNQLIADHTEIDIDEAEGWGEMVNRMKHPDKGNVDGLLNQNELTVPSLSRMRESANTVLKQAMAENEG